MKDVTVTLVLRGAYTIGFKAADGATRAECLERAKREAWDKFNPSGATLEYDDAAGHDVYFDDEAVAPECEGVFNGCRFEHGACAYCGQPAERAEDA